MAVPLLDVNAQNHPLRDELNEAFQRVLQSGQFILGDEVTNFEVAAAEFLGIEHVLGVSSGTDALLLALMALDIGQGDEVIVPSFTFFATAGCVRRLGAVPVFADVCPVCFNLDAGDVAKRLSGRTKAIIPVHLFGQCADMDALAAVADSRGIPLIEDAAQSFGAEYRGAMSGGIGRVGITSFFPSKNLGGLGDSGLLMTRDRELYKRCKILRMHGMEPKYHHELVGGNFRIDALQAAFLGVKLRHYPRYTAARQANAGAYLEALEGVPGIVIARHEDCRCVTAQSEYFEEAKARIVLPVAYPHNTHIWNQFTLRVRGEGERDRLLHHLRAKGVGCEIYYPIPLHQQKCFADLPVGIGGGLPVSEQLASEVLSIPVYPELSKEQRDEVIEAISGFGN